MVNPVLDTKIIAPLLRPTLVQRRRLFERLNGVEYSRLILVSAPAGYGKTTLVSSWVQKINLPTAWFSMDENDNDMQRFFTYLISALQKIYPGFNQPLLSALAEPGQISQERLLASLANELAQLPTLTRIVLDDYHLIENNEIHAALIFLLDHAPATIQFLLISRAIPPLPLCRWRGRGQITEIRARDLSFTLDETREFLNRVMGLGLSMDDVCMLGARTEGWVTGLQMAGLAIRALPAPNSQITDFVRTLSGGHRYILDYLRNEVINHQPLDIRRFLLQTSILERLTAPLCNAVLQIKNSQDILEYLERQNLFFTPLDDERRWFRYHHLFSELLQTCLAEESPENLPELHLRASQWYARNNDAGQAIAHALASGQMDTAIALAEKLWLNLYAKGEPEQSRHWLAKLPPEMVRQRPLLCLAQAISSSYTHPFDYDRLEDWALQASKTAPERLDQPLNHADLPYASVADLVNVYIAQLQVHLLRLRGQAPEAILQAAQSALAQIPENDFALRSSLWTEISRVYLVQGEAAAAERAIRQALALSEISAQRNVMVSALWTQAYIAYWQGRLRTALHIYQRAETEFIRPAEQAGKYISSTSVIYAFWGTILREFNRLEEAEGFFLKSRALAQFRDLADTALDDEIGLAWLSAYRGRESGIEALEKRLPQLPPKKVKMVQAHIARMKLLLGDRHPRLAAAAFRWASEQLSQVDPMRHLEEIYLIWVQALLLRKQQGNPTPDLRGVLEPLKVQQRLAEAGYFLRSQVKILILQALIFQEVGEMDDAIRAMGEALVLAQPEGYVRSFIDAREPIAALLRGAMEAETVPEYARELLVALKGEIPAQGAAASQSSDGQLLEPLTPREREVLLLVEAGFSNQEIAEQLALAPGTVKKYLSSVFRKMNANRRTQAVARAKASGLL